MKQLEAVIFDLDGVITDSAHFHYLAWKQLAADVDIEIDEAFNETLKGISRMDSLDLILAKGGRENDFTLEQKEELAAKKKRTLRGAIERFVSRGYFTGNRVLARSDSFGGPEDCFGISFEKCTDGPFSAWFDG